MAMTLQVFTMQGPTTITGSTTLSAGTNYVSIGPITINSGITVTVQGDWSIV